MASTILTGALLLAAATAAACKKEPVVEEARPSANPPPSQAATAAAADVVRPGTLEQGWDDATRESFWFTPQGSKIMPYAWFLAIERADSEEPLRSAANMERFRYIPMPKSNLNPDGLPLGFVRDPDSDGSASIGLTCAACHTSKLNLGGHEVIIDGGPTLADFKTFLHELNLALTATRIDDAKFARFAKKVLGAGDSDGAKAALRSDLTSVTAGLVARETQDHTDVPYGYARLDAFGGILNNVAATGLQMPENAAMPDAPVSYPFVWDAPQADRVQWNGSAINAPKIGGLIRNIGEVLGVFGRLQIKPVNGLSFEKGYVNSVNLENLGKLENWLRDLWSPKWPEAYLPKISGDLAQKGKAIYAQNCSSCHSVLDSRNPGRQFKATMVPMDQVGTDPTMASNYLQRVAKTGVLNGQRLMILAGDKLGPETRTFQIVVNGVVGVLLEHPLRALLIGEADARHARELAKLAPQAEPTKDDPGALADLKARLQNYADQLKLFDATTHSYKARPLNGVWATAPYLHNGSVPNLWELLHPASQRPKAFFVGSRQFDPKNVGLVLDGGVETTTIDTSLHGNSNAGHEYGTNLSDDDKWALIEYVKTL